MIRWARGEERGGKEKERLDIWQGRWAKIYMPNHIDSSAAFATSLIDSSAGEEFFRPLQTILSQCEKTRACPDLSDADWFGLGILRVFHEVKSGRGFLQEIVPHLPSAPDYNQFFATLRSPRRLAACQEADSLLAGEAARILPDALAGEPELEKFDVYAGDGHWHGAAAHDKAPFANSRSKSACGHLFAQDLRRGLLRHITTADGIEREHEHDLRALKRQTRTALRQGAPKGRKVLYIWDRAGIDYQAWQDWKINGGIYFVSREKTGSAFVAHSNKLWERADPRNAGILSDERGHSSAGIPLRRVSVVDALTGTTYVFITNEMTLPPGLIAELYRRRWDIEKSFDTLKNKFGETRAWATSPTAKTMQALFICMTHQLLLVLSHHLDRDHDITPKAELQRRRQRIDSQIAFATAAGRAFPSLRAAAKNLSQFTVKFLRWLRHALRSNALWHHLLDSLRLSYAKL